MLPDSVRLNAYFDKIETAFNECRADNGWTDNIEEYEVTRWLRGSPSIQFWWRTKDLEKSILIHVRNNDLDSTFEVDTWSDQPVDNVCAADTIPETATLPSPETLDDAAVVRFWTHTTVVEDEPITPAEFKTYLYNYALPVEFNDLGRADILTAEEQPEIAPSR